MEAPASAVYSESDYAGLLPELSANANKYTRGTVAIVGGSRDYPGAPLMAGLAAARCGAGYVRLVMPKDAARVARAHVLSIPVTACPQGESGTFCTASLETCLEALRKSRVIVLGPGMGAGEETEGFLRGLAEALCADGSERSFVLDADALNILARDNDLAELWRGHKTVLTPHEGEAARLLGRRVQDRNLDAAALVQAFDATVVLKGPATLVASRGGTLVKETCAGPELAKAGTGDVLAGMIGSLCAQGLAPADASALGVHLHALAAKCAACQIGIAAVMPEDIISNIGISIRKLGGATRA